MSRYVAVRLQNKARSEEYSGREYTYIDGVGLVLDDLVMAPTINGDCIAKVTQVGLAESNIDREILSKLKTITKLYYEGGNENE